MIFALSLQYGINVYLTEADANLPHLHRIDNTGANFSCFFNILHTIIAAGMG